MVVVFCCVFVVVGVICRLLLLILCFVDTWACWLYVVVCRSCRLLLLLFVYCFVMCVVTW